MEKLKYYIQIFYEKRAGFHFEQPIERLNGKSYYEYPEDSFERQNWGTIYWDSYKYNLALAESKFHSEFWKNDNEKEKAFVKIYDFIKSGKSGLGSSITALLPFEIYLMNDGFEMISFSEMNAMNPGISIIAEKQIGDEIINPKGIRRSRCYLKNDNLIYLAFGIEFDDKKTNFYFKMSKSPFHFQVDNDIEQYENAINGRLPKLEPDVFHNLA